MPLCLHHCTTVIRSGANHAAQRVQINTRQRMGRNHEQPELAHRQAQDSRARIWRKVAEGKSQAPRDESTVRDVHSTRKGDSRASG